MYMYIQILHCTSLQYVQVFRACTVQYIILAGIVLNFTSFFREKDSEVSEWKSKIGELSETKKMVDSLKDDIQ